MKRSFHLPAPSRLEEELPGLRETRPFFWFLIVVLVGLYAISLYSNPALRQPPRFLPYTLLAFLHIILHWFMPYFVRRSAYLVFYLLIQTVIAFSLSVLSQQPGVVMGLYMSLAGEAMGILENWRRSVVVTAVSILLIAFTVGLMWDSGQVLAWVGMASAMMLFVAIYVALFLRQLNARQEAQQLLAELQAAHSQLADYARQVETLTLEAERQRMARELHDTLAQGLAGLVLQLEALEAHLERGNSDKATQIAGQVKDRARATLADARSAIDDLRTAQELSAATIEREVERFTATTGIPCALTLPLMLALPEGVAEHVVRCVSEGLANVARHAQATRAWVTMGEENGRFLIEIGDDGQGFNADGQVIPNGHYGLMGLRERARLAGGILTITSQPGNGTILRMTIPFVAKS